jgi:hypothetical protein
MVGPVAVEDRGQGQPQIKMADALASLKNTDRNEGKLAELIRQLRAQDHMQRLGPHQLTHLVGALCQDNGGIMMMKLSTK